MPKRKSPAVTLARPRTVKMIVDHPRLRGEREQVERVVTTLDGILSRARLPDGCQQAARKFADASQQVAGAAGGAMDFDRIRSHASSPGFPPYISAANVLSEARRAIPQLCDWLIVDLVCGHSLTVAEVTRAVFHTNRDRQRRFVGQRLRVGLIALAALWYPSGREGRVRAYRTEGARPVEMQAGEVERGAVYHAA